MARAGDDGVAGDGAGGVAGDGAGGVTGGRAELPPLVPLAEYRAAQKEVVAGKGGCSGYVIGVCVMLVLVLGVAALKDQTLSFSYADEIVASSYATLGLSSDADMAAVRKAYRKLARIYHPDTTSLEDKDAAHRRFVEIARAYKNIKSLAQDGRATVEDVQYDSDRMAHPVTPPPPPRSRPRPRTRRARASRPRR
ncbi:uncharacterized protein AMSG_01047 [Thecamonas trahens ATCC 50062]|uniref:J domain-containing protein n=1 Tax=Thecamonas trahens ATCC 50062 TaxID=461836 RepID=A0A0L0DIL0_THETB|nr:hypothetical protein AMSG_01047 [Thecamonas trahens ATCC 50062]KNC52219.1 hypothetical protein AMSG_01047 [Thecamonas trahens ATCC 50062]|eukprot:XP_013762222.1 hypothetical protein AMSG_01047 [Thecamonas trahens ATCC 50062]